MTNLILDIKAALLYLTCFQYMEEHPEIPQGEYALPLAKEVTWLHENDYPDPTQVVYDEDGIPQVKWKSNKFLCSDICLDLYENINFDPKFFNQI